MADEALVFDRHAFADEGVRADLAPRPTMAFFLNLDERADARLIADRTSVRLTKSRMTTLRPSRTSVAMRRKAPVESSMEFKVGLSGDWVKHLTNSTGPSLEVAGGGSLPRRRRAKQGQKEDEQKAGRTNP